MTELLDQAFARLQTLSADMQDRAARLLLMYAGGSGSVITLTEEEKADLNEAQAEMRRGEYATDEEVNAVLIKYRY